MSSTHQTAPRYHIWTIGCQMNKAESERLSTDLESRGYVPAASTDDADVIVLNSCVVRQSAEDRIINKLQALRALKRHNPEVTLAVTGCWVETDTGALRQGFPHVDHFFGPGDAAPWLEPKDRSTAADSGQVCAYVPIIRGCDNYCSYCIVPYRRGREESRPLDDIICEVRERVRRGTREVTLLGQNVDSYGHDLPHRPDLADLLTELNAVSGLARIRFLTNHPKDMSGRLIDAMAGLDKVCEQLSLPVQSGSDAILSAMKRAYTAADYVRLAGEIRQRVPGVALSTDVIVGFPSETAARFNETRELLAGLRFDTVHSAAYSPRPGTHAARELDDDVPADEKKRRLATVEELQERIAAEINAGLVGRMVEVLVEGRKGDKWQGRTRTDKLVFFTGGEDCIGQLVPVRIDHCGPWSLQGAPAAEAARRTS